MKIKRLEICGFKSFVDRTVITFPDPITAIVGPNGCGKSNIVDAIRWCMGEQSAKHLRGRAMEDVIFTGSETRGPAGFAEVSLTFETYEWREPAEAPAPTVEGAPAVEGAEAAETQAAKPAEKPASNVPWNHVAPAEVVVTRRLHRDGTSEYLLGGVPCRLRDIVDFFLGTGVGTKAYSIIEQGRVGFIVSSKPEDRRSLIDEAAGITKYKAKKRVAEKRMEQTRQHLLRVTDIVGEIDARLRSLRLQAQKAERYKRYRAELKDLELWSASHKFLGLFAEEKSLTADRAEYGEQHEKQALALATAELEVEAERLALTEEQAELDRAKDALFELSNKAQLALQRADHLEQEAESLERQADEGSREREDLVARLADNARALGEIDGQLNALVDEAAATRAELASREGIYEELRGTIASKRRQLDEAAQTSSVARTRIARAESDIEAARDRRQDLERRMSTTAAEDASLGMQIAEVEREGELLVARLSELEGRKESLAGRKAESQERVSVLKGEVSRGELELDTLRQEAHRRRSRLESLREIETRYESFQRGVRAVMQKWKGGHDASGTDTAGPVSWSPNAVRGLVADIVQPPPELETAVEAVLGERLGNVIVESHDVGVEAIEYLKQQSEGRSSFIPLELRDVRKSSVSADGLQTLEASPAIAVDPDFPSGEGVRGPMLELIGYDRQYDKVASYLLGDVVVVEDLRKALALWRETRTERTIVTLDGEVIDPQGVVTGGSRDSAAAGVLSQKREIRELEEVVGRIEADQAAAMDRHVATKQELADVQAELEETVAALRAAEMDVFAARKDLDRAERDRGNLENRRAQLQGGLRDLETSIANTARRLDELTATLDGERQRAADADTLHETLRMEVATLAETLDGMVGELGALKVAATQAEDRRATALSTAERLRRETAEQESRVARLGVQVADHRERLESLRGEAIRLRDEGTVLSGEAEERARAHGDHKGQVEERSAILARREADVRTARAEVTELRELVTTLELKLQEASLKRNSLEEHVASRYADVRIIDIVSDYHLRAPVGHDEENRIQELRGLIERMGDINLTAIEESEELQKRYDFLTTQRADLESAIGQLEIAIEKINKASRERFQEVFDAVNAKFQEVYPRLFGGGGAFLRLTEEGDLLEKGVEIIANPPGKKMSQNIELLSGGEKALTAVSLLFAIFLVKPSPFCVLDEVDAPLDEANVGRYSQAIREMTDRSQFIVISHNKRTMEVADRLCGVTMEEPGVSKLVAVNLRGSKIGKGHIATQPGTGPSETIAAQTA